MTNRDSVERFALDLKTNLAGELLHAQSKRQYLQSTGVDAVICTLGIDERAHFHARRVVLRLGAQSKTHLCTSRKKPL